MFSHSPISIQSAHVVQQETMVEEGISTPTGLITSRHAIWLKIQSTAGEIGIGESWVNLPLWAPWERAALFEQAIIPYLETHPEIEHIPTYIATLFQAFADRSRQAGSVAALMQAVCAVEGGLWDLAARQAGQPLSTLLFDQPHSRIQVYGSSFQNRLSKAAIDTYLEKGVSLFKLQMGEDDERDKANLKALSNHLAGRAEIVVDVNRGWTFQQALGWLPILADYGVVWLEEPLTYDDELWAGELQVTKQVPIAGGENVVTPPGSPIGHLLNFPFDLWQPDVTKYTPFHMALALNQGAKESGRVDIVPHFLGSGPGLALSLQLAAGCRRGLVEFEINPNPLLTDACDQPFEIVDGYIEIPNRPGIGWAIL